MSRLLRLRHLWPRGLGLRRRRRCGAPGCSALLLAAGRAAPGHRPSGALRRAGRRRGRRAGLRIEVGLRLTPARIDRIRLVRRTPPARIAVARVRTLAVPRLVMKPPPPPDTEAAAFGALQQHNPDQGEHEHQMDDNDDGLHAVQNPSENRRGRPVPARVMRCHIGSPAAVYTIRWRFPPCGSRQR